MTSFFVISGLIILFLIGLYVFWSKRIETEIIEGAAIEWKRLQIVDPLILKGHTEESFNKIYRKIHFPRFPKYALGIVASFALALPVVFGILSGALWAGEKIGIVAQPAELAKYVPLSDGRNPKETAYNEERALYLAKDFAGFYYYFGLFVSWLGIVAIFMRTYHKRAPDSLRDELIRSRE